MKLSQFFVIPAIILFLFISCDDEPATVHTTGTINGNVFDDKTNLPLSNVLIITDPASESIVSDISGNFVLNNVPVGNVEIIAEKSGYISQRIGVNIVGGKSIRAQIPMQSRIDVNKPPAVPSSPFPRNGAKMKDSILLLSWNCSDPENDPITYSVYFSETNPPMNKIATNLKSKEFLISNLKENTNYFWKVEATDEFQKSSVSDVWTFERNKYNYEPSQSLIANWSFDDGTASDNSGNNNDGFIKGKYEIVDGIKGNAVRVSGMTVDNELGGHVILPNIRLDLLDKFTITLWVLEESFAQPWGECYIYFGSPSKGWIGISHSGNYIDSTRYLSYSAGANSIQNYLRISYDYSDRNKWVFYSLVYNAGTMYAYINAKLIGQIPQTLTKNIEFAALGRNWWINDGKIITSTRMNGMFDEVRIYGTALTEVELKDLYTN